MRTILESYGPVEPHITLVDSVLDTLVQELKRTRINVNRGLNGAIGSHDLLRFSLSIESCAIDSKIAKGFLFNCASLALSLRLSVLTGRIDVDMIFRFLLSSISLNTRYTRIIELSSLSGPEAMIRTSTSLISPSLSLKLTRFFNSSPIVDRSPSCLSRTIAQNIQLPRDLVEKLLEKENFAKVSLLGIQLMNGSSILEATKRLGMTNMHEGIVYCLFNVKLIELSKLFASKLQGQQKREMMMRFRDTCTSIPIRNYVLSFLEVKICSLEQLVSTIELMTSELGSPLRSLCTEMKKRTDSEVIVY